MDRLGALMDFKKSLCKIPGDANSVIWEQRETGGPGKKHQKWKAQITNGRGVKIVNAGPAPDTGLVDQRQKLSPGKLFLRRKKFNRFKSDALVPNPGDN
jgi:hypothetical protein